MICIVIADHRLIDNAKAYHHCFSLYDPKEEVPFPRRLLEIHTLEIPKVPAESDSTPLWSWMRFFAARSEGEFAMTVKDNPALSRLYTKLQDLSADETVRQQAQAREDARRDEASRNAYRNRMAKEEGKAEGKAEGKREKAREMARAALQKNYPIQEISELTGLSIEEILALTETV